MGPCEAVCYGGRCSVMTSDEKTTATLSDCQRLRSIPAEEHSRLMTSRSCQGQRPTATERHIKTQSEDKLTRAKVIWQKVSSLVHIFRNIRQVAACVVKLQVHLGPIVGEAEVVGSAMYHLTVVSYRLCIMTTALSLIIWLQFATECLRHSNQQV